MATIRKRSWTTQKGETKSVWQVDYRDSGGKRRSKQFALKRDADAWSRRAEWEVSQGTHTPDSQSVTVSKACDLWIKTAEGNELERSTIKQYQEWANLHIKPLLGDKKLSRLTTPEVETFKDTLLETRSRAMAAKVVRGLASVLADAQRRGLVAQNVAKPVKVVRSKRDRAKIVIPPKDDLRKMLEEAAKLDNENPGLRPRLLTVIFTGLRSSEIRALRKVDVDLKKAHITVCQRADQWGVIGPPKSEAGRRTIPIPPMLVSELRAWMLRAPKSEKGLLFPNSEGGVMLHSNMLRREYWPLQVRAGLTRRTGKWSAEGEPIVRAKYSFHCLRHAAASAWIKQKVDLKRLTTWLGHSSVQMTLDTYGHLLTDASGDAALVAAAQAELMA